MTPEQRDWFLRVAIIAVHRAGGELVITREEYERATATVGAGPGEYATLRVRTEGPDGDAHVTIVAHRSMGRA
jgi:hypothetical protein